MLRIKHWIFICIIGIDHAQSHISNAWWDRLYGVGSSLLNKERGKEAMKATRIMNASCKQIQQLIQENVLEDIYQSTGKRISADKLSAPFEYQKTLKNRMGKMGKVKASIDELSTYAYQASFFSAQGKNTLRYTWKAIDERHVEVIYEEAYEANTKANDWNFHLMSFLYKRNNKKRMQTVLQYMEDALKQQAA